MWILWAESNHLSSELTTFFPGSKWTQYERPVKKFKWQLNLHKEYIYIDTYGNNGAEFYCINKYRLILRIEDDVVKRRRSKLSPKSKKGTMETGIVEVKCQSIWGLQLLHRIYLM